MPQLLNIFFGLFPGFCLVYGDEILVGLGRAVFAGLETLLESISDFRFEAEDLEYLSEQKVFQKSFLDYLGDFKFRGEIHAMEEGTLAFRNEPLIRVQAPLIEAQLLESLLLNIINF